VILDLLDQQPPSLVLAGVSGLFDRDLFARQHMQTAGEDGRFDHRALDPVPLLTLDGFLIAIALGRRLGGRRGPWPASWVDAGDAAEIAQNCRDLFAGKLDLRHFAVARAHALGEALLQLVDWVFEINLPHRGRRRKRACAVPFKRMALAAMRLQDRLSLARAVLRQSERSAKHQHREAKPKETARVHLHSAPTSLS
jgi:hypothetical protein